MWTEPELVRACCPGLDPAFDLTESIRFASTILYRLSGRRWPGVCEQTVWPCAQGGCHGGGDATWAALSASGWDFGLSSHPSVPVAVPGGWSNVWACRGNCWLPCIELPGPINEIVSVHVGGEELDPSAYVVQADRRLCRVDGHGWPCGNSPANPLDPNAWSIDYTYGTLPPAEGSWVAAQFACQVALNRCGSGSGNCILPSRIRHISREGVDLDTVMMDSLDFLQDGKVGIYEVDLWLESVNPSKLKRRAGVYRADAPTPSRTFS